MKKYFLTTALMGTFIAPAFGADKIITSTNTCTVDVLGVSDNNATANTIATWSLIEYECGAGQYLLNSDGTLKCTECPAGSYCPGGKYTVESDTNGANVCPTDYTSDAGAVGENECYMGCELACSKNVECPAHSNNCIHSEFKTTGKQFSGGACNAYSSVCPIADFQCDMGYRKEKMSINDISNIYQSLGMSFDESSILACSVDNQDLTDNGVNDCEIIKPGQLSLGWMLVEFSNNEYDNKNTIGLKQGSEYQCYDDTGEVLTLQASYLSNANFQGMDSGKNLWARLSNFAIPTPATELLVKFTKSDESIYNQDAKILLNYLEDVSEIYSMLKADDADAFVSQAEQELRKNLSTKNVNKVIEVMKRTKNGEINSEQDLKSELFNIIFTEVASYNHVNSLSPEIQRFVTVFNDSDASIEEQGVAFITAFYSTLNFVETNSPWVGLSEDGRFDTTKLYNILFNLNCIFGAFVSLEVELSLCQTNTINIDWNPDNGGAHIQNMCYYDGVVALPSDPVKPGYTFTGWKLVE